MCVSIVCMKGNCVILWLYWSLYNFFVTVSFFFFAVDFMRVRSTSGAGIAQRNRIVTLWLISSYMCFCSVLSLRTTSLEVSLSCLSARLFLGHWWIVRVWMDLGPWSRYPLSKERRGISWIGHVRQSTCSLTSPGHMVPGHWEGARWCWQHVGLVQREP